MEHSARHAQRIAEARSWGFVSQQDQVYLQYCHECQRENYTLMVANGRCAFCGAGPSEPIRNQEPA